jgi:hypothetical protein
MPADCNSLQMRSLYAFLAIALQIKFPKSVILADLSGAISEKLGKNADC